MKHFQILAFFIFLQILSVSVLAQNKFIPTFSGAAIHHLGRAGVNVELGTEYEVFKHLSVSAGYRYSKLSNKFESEIEINALALNLSLIVINRNNNRLSISTGLNAGNYYSLTVNSANTYNPEHVKDYNEVWWNPVKIQYDYTFSNHFMIGSYLGWYGDDGDNSNLIGILLAYKFE